MNNSVIKKIDIFLSRKDQSLKVTNEIEAELLALFPEDEYIEDVTDALAQYKPGGGDFLFQESDIEQKFIFLRKYLLSKNHQAE